MNLFMPWFAQIHCGNRNLTNQSDFSTNSISVNVSRIATRDSGGQASVENYLFKESLERKPLLSRRTQTLTDKESESPSDRQNRSSSDEEDLKYYNENYGSVKSVQFANIIGDAIHAIREGVYPERIRQGSSGSYFVKNCEGETIGVFKPKNEEPYGQLNPRWMKWIHRIFFPCCFGRSCLLPNQEVQSSGVLLEFLP
ncbi:Phosphatidylinositol 4-kinase type 2-beta [Dirofilaria immitis]|nr:Phosphatidylinositol 4-kinase type 2-beta [Dirofilaria immitis]